MFPPGGSNICPTTYVFPPGGSNCGIVTMFYAHTFKLISLCAPTRDIERQRDFVIVFKGQI